MTALETYAVTRLKEMGSEKSWWSCRTLHCFVDGVILKGVPREPCCESCSEPLRISL